MCIRDRQVHARTRADTKIEIRGDTQRNLYSREFVTIRNYIHRLAAPSLITTILFSHLTATPSTSPFPSNHKRFADFHALNFQFCYTYAVGIILVLVVAGNHAYCANNNLLRSTIIFWYNEMKRNRTLIKLMVSYGSDVWALTTAGISTLKVFGWEIIRKFMAI